MRQDLREIYLQRLLNLDKATHLYFDTFLRVAELILQNPSGGESGDIKKVREMVDDFKFKFHTEKGTPSLYMILYQMEIARSTGHKYLKIKTSRTMHKFRYIDLRLEIEEIEGVVWDMIREKSKQIRLLIPSNAP